MAYLIDTNILIRLTNSTDPQWAIADSAVAELFLRNEALHITPQNLIEFRNVATRPKNVNGLGLAIPDAEARAANFEGLFSLLPDVADIYPAWKAVVGASGVIGKQVHDARLVAVCHVYKVMHLLTFNTAHFATMASCGPGLVVVDPASV